MFGNGHWIIIRTLASLFVVCTLPRQNRILCTYWSETENSRYIMNLQSFTFFFWNHFFYVWKFPYLLLITVFWPWHPNMYNHVNILNSKCMYITIVVAAIQKHVMDNVRVPYHGFRGDEMVITICVKVKGHAIIICLHGRNSCIGKCQCLKNGICPKEQIKYFYFTTIVANRIQ